MQPGDSPIQGSGSATATPPWSGAREEAPTALQTGHSRVGFPEAETQPAKADGTDRVGVSILLPTYNRRLVLARTLEDIGRSDMSGLDVEIVVIDSNGPEGLRESLAEFQRKLPIVFLRENRPGKNCALNKALRECRLRDFVVFIDDDISPRADWLQKLVAASARWPTSGVFGARVNIGWPDGKPPAWVKAKWIKVFGFAWHDLGEEDLVYPPDSTPMGGCVWLRRAAFPTMPLFDESIGPRPTNRIMGGEVLFLLRLQRSGVQMTYCPDVQVEHRISASECTIAALRRRAFRCGRGEIRLFGLHRPRYHAFSRVLWTLILLADAAIYSGGRLVLSVAHPASHRRAEFALRAMSRIGRIFESLRLGWRPGGASVRENV